MNKKEFIAYLKDNDFAALFSEMGYDNPSNRMPLPLNIVEGEDELAFDFEEVAQKSSFKIYRADVEQIPTNSLCKKIDHRLRKYGENYIAIFTMGSHHLWIIPVKTVEKRTLVSIEYEDAGKAEFLAQKMDNLSFGVDEEVTITDVTSRVQKEFAVNSEKITKDFYTGFRKQHDSFAKFISGIDVEGDRQWYVSVMLNRLMFCYFIQKKGFLDFDPHYLRHKLEWVKEHKGEDKYFTFYKGFLKALFHGGLNAPSKKRLAEFEKTYGKIPYLNGGMFDEHQIERDYKDIDIKDEAFEALFDFFDKWNWHLDTRISASGKDINPDVLGYIFEQYINDRAQMGAYYTKEDITEYIGKNCIVPYLMNAVKEKDAKAFEANGFVWSTLKNSGDAYIYDAVKKGVDLPLPDYIEEGVDTSKPNLLERRSRWNEKADEELALPTEIWRETVERRERCKSLREKIAGGEITDINDFITYNLDIRKFADDLITSNDADEEFVGDFYEELRDVTVLDPTCGSGAFLFAAMNTLEPLYENCIERMEDFNKKTGAFQEELDEIRDKYRSNIQYFIYKSIILRNLYGVDIMHEAVEIAKLRLFLKMVAVVEVDKRADNLGLDPLPDIDFNVRCGNTLVGFANENELERSFEGDAFEMLKKDEIEDEMADVAKIYDGFRQIQLDGGDLAAFKESKKTLLTSLKKLNKTLDKKLFATNGMGKTFDEWKNDAQPFHWLSEFYQIIHGNGGFDVIIGNPPYVEYNKKDSKTKKAVSDIYKLNGDDGKTPCAYKTLECGNLYAYCIERSKKLLHMSARFGMIVPNSSVTTPRMGNLAKILRKGSWFSFYDFRPSHLFDGVNIRLAIFISDLSEMKTFSSKYNRWYSQNRNILFKMLSYGESKRIDENVVVKTASTLETKIFEKVFGSNMTQATDSKWILYYHDAILYWLRGTNFEPSFEGYLSSHVKKVYFPSKSSLLVAIGIFNSSLFYWFWTLLSNSRDLSFDIFYKMKGCALSPELQKLVAKLMDDLDKNGVIKERNQVQTGLVRYKEFYPVKSKSIIDEIDKVLAKHYGFTEEELDFIINYDIKYRMGDELNTEEE